MTRSSSSLLSSIRKKTTTKHASLTEWNDISLRDTGEEYPGKRILSDEEFAKSLTEKCGVPLGHVVTLTEVQADPITFLTHPAVIKRLASLRQIDFSGVPIIHTSMYISQNGDDPCTGLLCRLSLLPNLRSLRLSTCQLSSARFLAALPNLEYCDLSHNRISDLSDLALDLQKANFCLNLHHLDLRSNTFPDTASLPLATLGTYFLRLRRLDFRNCPGFNYDSETLRRVAESALPELDTFCGVAIKRKTNPLDDLFSFSPDARELQSNAKSEIKDSNVADRSTQLEFSEQVATMRRNINQQDSPASSTSTTAEVERTLENVSQRDLGTPSTEDCTRTYHPENNLGATKCSVAESAIRIRDRSRGAPKHESDPPAAWPTMDKDARIPAEISEPARSKSNLARWREQSLRSDPEGSDKTKSSLQTIIPQSQPLSKSKAWYKQSPDLPSSGSPLYVRTQDMTPLDNNDNRPQDNHGRAMTETLILRNNRVNRRMIPDTLSNLSLETPKTPVLLRVDQEETGKLLDSQLQKPDRQKWLTGRALESQTRPIVEESTPSPRRPGPGTLNNPKLLNMNSETRVQPRRSLRDQPDAAMLENAAVKVPEAPVSLIGVKLVNNNSVILAEQSLAEDPAFKRRQAEIRRLNENRKTLQPTELVGQTHPWTQDNIVFPGIGSSDEILTVNEICQYWNKLSSILVWAVDSRRVLENEVRDLNRQCEDAKGQLTDLISKFQKMRSAYLASLRRLSSLKSGFDICGELAQLVRLRGDSISKQLGEVLSCDMTNYEIEVMEICISGKFIDGLPCFLGALMFAWFGEENSNDGLNSTKEALYRLNIGTYNSSEELGRIENAAIDNLKSRAHNSEASSSKADPLTCDQLRDLILRIHESHNVGISVILESYVELCTLRGILKDSCSLLETVQYRVAECLFVLLVYQQLSLLVYANEKPKSFL